MTDHRVGTREEWESAYWAANTRQIAKQMLRQV
jgi:hypothetical protein